MNGTRFEGAPGPANESARPAPVDIRMVTADCRQALAEMPPSSIDCGVTDPPYEDTNLSWDKHAEGWIAAASRVLRPNASLWIFGSFRSLSQAVVPELRAHGWKYAQDIIWIKQNGTGFHADRFRRVHELAIQFYRGKWASVYKQPQYTPDARARIVRRVQQPEHTGQIGSHCYVSRDGGPRLMTTVARVRNEHRRAIHPTQKPVELLLPLVRYSCPPGGTVLDCFAGSGSLGVAAKVAGRSAVLIEQDPRIADAARRRLLNDAPLLDEMNHFGVDAEGTPS